MGTASIPLAKGLNLNKMEFPALLSIKYDGVPVKVTIDVTLDSYTFKHESRFGKFHGGWDEDILTFVTEVAPELDLGKHVFVFETTHVDLKDFKDIEGLCRRKVSQDGLIYNLFDYWWSGSPDACFQSRIQNGSDFVHELSDQFRVADQWPVYSVEEAKAGIAYLEENFPNEEGFIIVAADRKFKPNTRHWDYQKIVVDPMIDLRIVGFKEAETKDGQPKGMIGRIEAEYKGEVIGIGPGRMPHSERRELWEAWIVDPDNLSRHVHPASSVLRSSIATIQHKRDDSYTALRQPTFQHWRPDKDEPNEETP